MHHSHTFDCFQVNYVSGASHQVAPFICLLEKTEFTREHNPRRVNTSVSQFVLAALDMNLSLSGARPGWDCYRRLRWTFAVMHALNFIATMTLVAVGRFVDFSAPIFLIGHCGLLLQMNAGFVEMRAVDALWCMVPRWNSVVLRLVSVLFTPAATSLMVDRVCDNVLTSRLSDQSFLNAAPPTPIKPTALLAAMHTAECLSDKDDKYVKVCSHFATVFAAAIVFLCTVQNILLIKTPGETLMSSPVAIVALLISTATGFGLCITVILWKLARPELEPLLTAVKALLVTLDGLLLLAVVFDPYKLSLSSTQIDSPAESATLLLQLWWFSAVTSCVSLAVVTLLLFVRHVVLDDAVTSTPFIERALLHFRNLILVCILCIAASGSLRFTWLLFYMPEWTAGSTKGDPSAPASRLRHVLSAFLTGDYDDASVARRCAFVVSELHRHSQEHSFFSTSNPPSVRGFYLLTTFLSTHVEALAVMDGARAAPNGDDIRDRMLPEVLTTLGMKLERCPIDHHCVAEAYEILLAEPEVRGVLDAYHAWRCDVPGLVGADSRCTRQWAHDNVLQPQRVARLLSAVVEPTVYACGYKACDEAAEAIVGKWGCRWLKAWTRWVWIPLHVVLCGGTTAALLVDRVHTALADGVRDPLPAVQLLCVLGCGGALVWVALQRRFFWRRAVQTQRLMSALGALVPNKYNDVDECKLCRALLQYEADPDGAEGPSSRRCQSTCCTIPMDVLPFRGLRDVICRYHEPSL